MNEARSKVCGIRSAECDSSFEEAKSHLNLHKSRSASSHSAHHTMSTLLARFRGFLPSAAAAALQRQPLRFGSATAAAKLQELALEENCILVDESDRVLGNASKRDCHRVDPDGNIRLHRAFSVFLFNSRGEMLLQRRSTHKVIFG